MSTEQQILRLGGSGILEPKDLRDLNEAVRRVYELMRDGRWYSAEEIEMAAGVNGRPAREGLRRMRELRSAGYEIDRERCDDNRVFRYRLKIRTRGLPAFWRD